MEIALCAERYKSHEQAVQYSEAELVDMYSEAVYKFCRRLTYNKEDAEDLFQETFIKAFGQPKKLSENPKSFLFSTAVYLWKSQKRKYARRNQIAPVVPLDVDIADENALENSVVADEDNRIVRAVVDSLPEKFKIPIVLYYTVEMSIPEISKAVKLPEGTVKSRLHKARKLIEKGLIESGYER